MKIVLLCSILFCAITLPALGELDDADLNKIRLVVNEVVEKEISESEKRLKEYIDTKNENLDKKLSLVNENLDKRLSLVTILICGLIALIVVAVGIPQIIIAWRSTHDKNIDDPTPEIKIITETSTQ